MRTRLPGWLRSPGLGGDSAGGVNRLLSGLGLNTVCREASCPNRGRCFESGTATFLIMGRRCTRACRYCAVDRAEGPLPPPDPEEPSRVGAAVAALGLRHAVITSVTRDDLPDGGASVFAETVESVRSAAPGCTVEVLTPDMGGSGTAVGVVAGSSPAVFNHNIETVDRLFPLLRPGASYRRSLGVLETYGRMSGSVLKSGMMLGLGEEREEVLRAFRDLRESGVEVLTLGQYLSPSSAHHPVARFLHPDEFEELREAALEAGFGVVVSGPLVRSSFQAAEALACIRR